MIKLRESGIQIQKWNKFSNQLTGESMHFGIGILESSKWFTSIKYCLVQGNIQREKDTDKDKETKNSISWWTTMEITFHPLEPTPSTHFKGYCRKHWNVSNIAHEFKSIYVCQDSVASKSQRRIDGKGNFRLLTPQDQSTFAWLHTLVEFFFIYIFKAS